MKFPFYTRNYELRHKHYVASSLFLVIFTSSFVVDSLAYKNASHPRKFLHRRKLHHKYHKGHINQTRLYSNTWAVRVHPPHHSVAERIAKKHGFKVLGKIGNLEGHFHFKHEDVGESEIHRAKEKTDLLQLENEVKWVQQQEILERFKRDYEGDLIANQILERIKRDHNSVPNDPYFKDMWYLLNTGQATGPAGVDINVVGAWKRNITGRGIVIAVLDDGVDYTHPDLEPNYDSKASYDFNDNDPDPKPRDSDPDNCHGTRCAGEVSAVANNGICGVGVAYNSKIGGVRMLDGQATDALEASALGFKSNYIDIYINCWGPKDDGKTFGKPGPIASKALRDGAEKGRNGLGSIFIWATGNGGLTDDDCNCDGYTTSIYTISIGCIGDHGLSAYYTEKCSSTLAVTFNGASHKEGKENKMVTTDLYHQCTEEFKGTSASAPLAAGIVALTLEANPSLTWRDIQHLVVNTAQITSPVDEGWMKNGAGFHFNHKFGFGRLDAAAMVEAAVKWQKVGPQKKCTAAAGYVPQDIPRGDSLYVNIPTQACSGSNARVTKLEHVVLTVSFVHRRRGDVSIDLYSPKGTKSQMLSTRKYDDSDEGLDEWNFMTVHNWGEEPRGIWRLRVTDNIEDNDFLSQEQTDVEDLEEQVIDTQTKMQKSKWDAMRAQNPSFDAPYPPGVKKDFVIHQDPAAFPVMDGGVSTPVYPDVRRDEVAHNRVTLTKDGLISPVYNSNHGTERSQLEYDRSFIPNGPKDTDQIYINDRPGEVLLNDLPRSEYEIRLRRSSESGDSSGESESGSGNGSGSGGVSEDTDNLESEDSKNFSSESNKKDILEKKDRINLANLDIFKSSNNYRKVQVTEEETGTPRVQVNAGYENPRITCVSGSNDCNGVFLKWALTFYGTDG